MTLAGNKASVLLQLSVIEERLTFPFCTSQSAPLACVCAWTPKLKHPKKNTTIQG